MTTKTGFSRYLAGGLQTRLEDLTPPSPYRSDCSQWIYAVYKKAGAGNPGLTTDQMAAKGQRVGKPKPGDIMLIPGHCELYIGGDPKRNTIGHGSPPIDYGSTSNFPGHFFVTYDFLDSESGGGGDDDDTASRPRQNSRGFTPGGSGRQGPT